MADLTSIGYKQTNTQTVKRAKYIFNQGRESNRKRSFKFKLYKKKKGFPQSTEQA